MSEDDDVANVRAICEVSNERARELMEAASGSLERAVEIHLQQQPQRQPQHATHDSIIGIDDDHDDVKGDEHGNVVVAKASSNNRGDDKNTTTKPPPTKKARMTHATSPPKNSRKKKSSKSPSPGKQQGTLDTFLGLPSLKKEPPRQRTIDSFFGKQERQGVAVAAEGAAAAEPKCDLPDEAVSNDTQKSPAINGNDDAAVVLKKKEEHREEPTTKGSAQIDDNGPNITNSPARNGNYNLKREPRTPPDSAKTRATTTGDPRLHYAALAKAFTEMTSTTKRHAKLNSLKTVLVGVIEALGSIHGDLDSRQKDGRMLTCALELVSGKLSLGGNDDDVSPMPLQVSGAAVSTAVQTVTGGVAKSRLREVYRRTGDLGDTAAEFFVPGQSVKNFFVARTKVDNNSNNKIQAKEGASIARIHGLLREVAMVRPGAGSQKERQVLLVKLLRLSTSKEEMRFLVRTLIGNMRLGATMKSILAALAMAVVEVQEGRTATPQEPAIQRLQKTFDICPKLNKIALSLLCGGVEKMEKECCLEVGCPIQPMLANPAHALAEVEKLMTKTAMPLSEESAIRSMALAEWKYDGMRCQAHFDGTKVKLFSRHLLDNTAQFPDAAKFLLEARRENEVESFIIDSEIVGVASTGGDDKETRLLPFQVLSTRRGTKSLEDGNAVQIRVFAFDLMYLNGESLLSRPLWERQNLLRQHFRTTDGFTFASSLELPVYDEIQITTFLQEAVKGGAEGLMVKLTGKVLSDDGKHGTENVPRSLSCPYESGTRSQTWLKLKRDYVSGFSDTIDVVPIGAWYGSGRKAEKGFLSPILFAVYDEDDGVFRSISRCMSFTDDMYKAIGEFYFNGTPYPSTVGLSSSTEDAAGKGELVGESTNAEASDSDGDNVDVQQRETIEDSDASDIEDENDNVGVNCFPGRPSSSVYVTNENPTIWFKPCEVWEVSFADLTLSRTHTAAAGLVEDPESRGVALRFPRFKRRRPDKGVEQATTSIQIAQLFTKQFKQS